MNKEKFNELAVQAGFIEFDFAPGKIFSPEPHDETINKELEMFKNLLLDEVIKKANAMIKWQTRFGAPAAPLVYEYNAAIAYLIEKIEAMK